MKHKKDKTKFNLIEGHSKNQTKEFIELYNQGYNKNEIRKKLHIGHFAYKNYFKDNEDKLNHDKQYYRECVICGEDFKPVNNSQKYCSTECRQIGNSKRLQAYYKEHKEEIKENRRKYYHQNKEDKKYPVKPCKHCGGLFAPSHPLQVYCSDDCKKEASNKRRKLRRKWRWLKIGGMN